MINELVKVIKNCRKCVVLTGAGISAESGVPTFRGKEGLWGKFKPEELATMEAFMANSKIVWEWYNWRRDLMNKVKPNPGHEALVKLESVFDEFTLITQNVDGLHRIAGSENVLEIHGNIYRNKCSDCNKIVTDESDIDPENIPACEHCGGKIRPDVVWFGEMLDEDIISEAYKKSEEADIFFSIGTSAVVHPAATLPIVAKRYNATLVEINPEATPLTDIADFNFEAASGEFLPQLLEELKTGK